MLDKLRQFIADVVSPHEHQAFDDTGYRLAATALLVHVISLDGEPSELEKRKLHSLLESRFKLDPGTADQLIASATLVEGEAVPPPTAPPIVKRVIALYKDAAKQQHQMLVMIIP